MKTSFSHTSNPNRLNNIVYVEPNYNNSAVAYDSSGLNVFEQAPDLSDYSIFVNLEVEVVGRTIKSEVNHYAVSWQTKAGSQESTVNFMEGSKIPLGESGKYINALTTNYTDCFLTDLKRIGGNTEMFGISSIDIAYNNYMVPEVTIEFVDVRGAALFSPRESQDGNDGALSQEQYDTAGSFFQCFFTFPYPKFTLLVKGFYGQPVSYELTCSDFRAKFDAQTGNFACTAKFVGYAFSFLSDVMVNAMVAAPYSDYIGADYWDAQNFELPGTNGGTYKMPKLAQLIEDAKNILANAEKEKEQNPAIVEANSAKGAADECNEILNLYNNFSNALKKASDYICYVNRNDAKTVISNGDTIYCAVYLAEDKRNGKKLGESTGDVPHVSQGSHVESNWNAYDDLRNTYELLKENIEKFNSNHTQFNLPVPTNICEFKAMKAIDYEKTHSDGTPFIHFPPSWDNEYVGNQLALYKAFKEKVNKSATNKGFSGCTYAYFYKDCGLVDKIGETIEQVNSMSDELAELEQKALDEAVANQLGFWPSVENITRIIMAHFETFAKMIHKTGIEICSSNPLRTASSLGIADDELPDVVKDSTDNFVPPFPKVVKKVAANGTVTEEDAWVGDFSGDFREKDLVHGLINGITAVAKIVNSSSGDPYSNTSYGSTRQDVANMPRPLTSYDFVGANPYENLSNEALNDLDHIISIAALRGVSIINDASIIKNANYTDVGELEAENILSVCKLGTDAKSVLEGTVGNGAETYLSELMDAFVSNNAGKKPWGENQRLFEQNGSTLFLTNTEYRSTNGSGTGKFLPISNAFNSGWYSINRSKNGNPNPETTANCMINRNVEKVLTKKPIFSIDTDVNRIKNIVENSIKPLKDKLEDWALYDVEKYTDIAHAKSVFYKTPSMDDFKPSKGKRVLPKVANNIIPFEDELPDCKRIDSLSFSDDNGHEISFPEYTINELKENLESENLSDGIQVGTLSVFLKKDWYEKNKYVQAKEFLENLSVGNQSDKIKKFIYDTKSTIIYTPISTLLWLGATLKVNGPSKGLKDDLERLRNDYKVLLKKIFEKWVDDGKEFKALIKNEKFPSYDELIRELTLNVKSKISKNDFTGKTAEELKNKFGPNLLNSYLTVLNDLTLVCRGDSSAVKLLTYFRLKGCALINYSKLSMGDWSSADDSHDFKVDKNSLNSFLRGVLTGLKNANTNVSDTNDHINQAEVPANATTDIKIAVYRYCKLLYDKWLGGLTEEKFVSDWTKDRFFDESSNSEHDQYFHFIDCYYNKVGQRVPINLGDLCEQIQNCWQQGQYSLLSLLSDMYAKNKMQFLCVQNFKSLTDGMETLFDPIPYLEMTEPKRHPNFIVVYPYESSSKLDMEGQEYVNDTFMISQPISSRNKWPEALKSRSLGVYSGYNIPAFGVTYGKMYQSYFTGFDVNMNNPTVTEQSIKAMFQIASMNNEGEADEKRAASETVGQDLFTIYSNNSYDCTVTMMGCPWIQPLMYFCLNNVPMFRGTYQIINVNHHLEPGNMTTTFKGVRMANTATRIVREIFLRNTTDRAGAMEGPSIENTQANVDNDCEYKTYPLIYGSTDLSAFVNAPTTQSAEIQDALIVMNYFMANGFTKEAAAGICGNIAKESSWNINVIEDTTKANKGYGLCQWTDRTRLNVLKTRCGQKPDLKCQLDYCIAEWNCENNMNHLPGGCGSKAALMAAKTPEQAAEIVCWKFEAPAVEKSHIGERKTKARLYYNSYGATPIRTESSDDKKVSDLANGFLDAINKTAQSSAIGGIVTLDTGLSVKNTLWLKKAANGCELSSMFDVVVNAYYDKIESAYWVTSANSSKGEPSYIIVNVKEGSPSKTIKVVDSKQRPLNIINDLPDNFYRTIAKRYHFRKNGSDCVHDNTFAKEVPQFADHADVICNKAEIRDCGEILSELGASQGLLKSPIYVGNDNWDAAKAANFLIEHNVVISSAHICAFAVQQAIRAGGAEPSTGNGYRMVVNAINSRKWQLVAHGTNLTKAQSNNIQGYKPQVGDIFGMVKGNNESVPGHVCMFCGSGNGWISDFKQRQPLVYNTSSEYWIARYVGGSVKSGIKPTGLCFGGTCLKGSL